MSLDSILEESIPPQQSPKSRGNRIKSFLQRKLYEPLKSAYKDNVKVKFRLLYSAIAASVDRISTLYGIHYYGGYEGNPFEAIPAKLIGLKNTFIASMALVFSGMYFVSKIWGKKRRENDITESQFLGSVYMGVGLSESAVSLNNYLGMTGTNIDGFGYMSAAHFIPFGASLSIIPLVVTMAANKFRKSRGEYGNYKD